ncbi:MAG: ABC transporter permease [Acidimicrobiia bacterium]|nr:ABC transporter permease [Acidimicrobiia bacterium]
MTHWFNRWISHRFLALVQKELNQIRRDRRIMMSLILPPIMQLMLFGSVMNPEVANVNLGIVDYSQSPQSRDLIAALTQSGSFTLYDAYPSADDLGEDLRQSVVDAGIVIPGEFARDLTRGRPTTIQVLLNAMNSNTAAISQGYVAGVVAGFNQTRASTVQPAMASVGDARPMGWGRALLRSTLLYNPGGITTWYLVTGLFGTLLIMNGTITASTTMVKEREAGTLEQLLMTPAAISEIIVAKIAPPFFLLGITASVAIAVIRLYFQVPFHGSVPLVVISSALCLLCGIGIGTAVATITKSAQQAQLTTFFISPPLMSLSGAITPAEALPEWLRPWTAVNPVYHFGVITRASLIKGSGFADLWVNVLALTAFALVLVSISVWRFRKQLT